MPEIVEGVVNTSNERGFTLDMKEGWWNYSTKATPPPPRVQQGQRVRVTFSPSADGGSRWANKIEFLRDGASATNGLSKDVQIIRQSCLKAAVELAVAEKGDKLNLSAIFGDAELMEAWVLREEEPEPSASEEPEPEYTA